MAPAGGTRAENEEPASEPLASFAGVRAAVIGTLPRGERTHAATDDGIAEDPATFGRLFSYWGFD